MNSVVTEVVELLARSRYRAIEPPLAVAGIPVDVDALLVGTGRANDLVAVVDLDRSSDLEAIRNIRAISRALDVSESKRPFTTVLIGTPSMTFMDAVNRSTRALAVETRSSTSLRESLAILLPLHVPHAQRTDFDPLGELRAGVGRERRLRSLLDAALLDANAVRNALRDALASTLGSGGSPT